MKVTFKERISYAVTRGVFGLLAVLPEWLAYSSIAGLGRLYYRCSSKRQCAGMRMLRNAYPDERDEQKLQRLGRVATGNTFKVALDLARVNKFIRKGRLADVLDLSPLEGVLPTPPFIGVTGHQGSWEMAGVGMTLFTGAQAHVVARVFSNPLLQDWLVRNRRQANVHIHPKRGGIRGMARGLEQGGIGLQAVDQNQRMRGLFVPFFGELASTDRAAASLSLRSGYPIVVGRCERVGKGFRFRIHSNPPIVPKRTDDRDGDLRRMVTEMNRQLEAHILASPEQYLWIHDRYRCRPEPEDLAAAQKFEDDLADRAATQAPLGESNPSQTA